MDYLKKHFISKLFFLCVASVVLVACKGKVKDAEVAEATTGNSAQSTSCFEQYKTNLMKMLTKSEIASVYKGDMEGAELDSYKTEEYSAYGYYTYSWPGNSDRSERMIVNGSDYGAKDYTIGVGYLDFYDEDTKFIVKQFKNTYDLTDAKKAKAKKAINKELEKNGVDSKTKGTSESITKSIIPDLKFTPVEDIGDAAVWSYSDNRLIVLKGRVKFRVIVDISDNHQEDVDLAKKLARIILQKCE